jgi:hypothetical protein
VSGDDSFCWNVGWQIFPDPGNDKALNDRGFVVYDYLKDTEIKNGTPAVAGVLPEPALAVPVNPAPGAKVPSTPANNTTDESLFRTTSALLAINCVSDKLEQSLVIDVPDGGTSCRVVGLSNATGPVIIGKAHAFFFLLEANP